MELYCKIFENKLRTLRLQRFSYFRQFPDNPEASAFVYSEGNFSSIDDDGLKKIRKVLKMDFFGFILNVDIIGSRSSMPSSN